MLSWILCIFLGHRWPKSPIYPNTRDLFLSCERCKAGRWFVRDYKVINRWVGFTEDQ